MKPLTLVKLRCPKRCLLGIVVASDRGPLVITRRLSQTWVDKGSDGSDWTVKSRVEECELTFPMDDGWQLIASFACRHGGGRVQASDPEAIVLRELVAEVQTGQTRAGVDHILG